MSQGFFPKHIEQTLTEKNFEVPKTGPLCGQCGLYKHCQSPKMEYSGEGRKKCLIIAEAPGPDEDQQGTQLVGEVGQSYRVTLKKFGLDLDKDFWKINAVNCFPGRGEDGKIKEPSRTHLKCCKPHVQETIEKLQPNFIWLLGGKAVEAFYMDYFEPKKLKISVWRGLKVSDPTTKAWIFPQFHPSYPKRDPKNENLKSCYERDLQFAVESLTEPPPTFIDYSKQVECLYNFHDVITLLNRVLESDPNGFFFDYETTGIKPYAPGHKVASISFQHQSDSNAYSFPYQYRSHFSRKEQIEIKKRWRKILIDPKFKKKAHGLKFEEEWSRRIFGTSVINWCYSSMEGAHVLDNRKNHTSLNMQAYTRLGVLPYDKHVKPYLQSKGGALAFNRVDECDLRDLLHYGGMDSRVGLEVARSQIKEFEERGGRLWEAYQFLHRGLLEFADMQENGICIDEEYYKKGLEGQTDELIEIKKRLIEGREARKFKEKTGKILDIDSPKDLGTLFYEVLGATPIYTDKGNYCVDKEAVEKLKLPFTESLIRYRKLSKSAGTYFTQFLRLCANGKIHPTFDLHIPKSFRGSSSDPNFQNVPLRDPEIGRLCRLGIVPSPGNRLLEWDYKQIEVCVAACESKDPNLIYYVTHPESDMHRDNAVDLFKLPPEEITDNIRYGTKSEWTFAQFYGSYFVECARNLWELLINERTASGVPLKDHLRKHNMSYLESFTDHCKEVEDKFWNKRFPDYKQWKDDINKFYQKHGYIESKMGFKFKGLMSRNEATNYPIQGTAFHCLLWTIIKVGEVRREEDWKTLSIGQIHDAGVEDLVPDEQDHVIETINRVGTKDIRERFDWIIVPLKINFEVSKVGGNWWEKEKLAA